MRAPIIPMVVLGACISAVPVIGQQPPTPVTNVDLEAAVYARILELASTPEADATIAAAFPRVVAKPTQVQAPSGARGRTTLVDAADFPALIGVALDNELLNFEDASVTFDLNLFAFASLMKPALLDEQRQYSKPLYQTLRRFGGAVTLGGKGESIDRDGDERPDPALTAEHVADIVTAEVRWRFLGSRDRRDQQNLLTYIHQQKDSLGPTLSAAASKMQARVLEFIADHAVELATVRLGQSTFADPAVVEAFLSRDNVSIELRSMARELQQVNELAARALKQIDGAPIWTAVVGGTRRESQFGPNKWHAGLRGQATTALVDHALNVDFSSSSGTAGAPDSRTWKAGYQASVLILRSTALTQDGIAASFSANAEHYQNVPTAAHSTIVRSGFKIAFPLSATATLPVSITYANHRDLLTDQNEVIGHIGIAFDLSGVKKPVQ